eukprot:248866-Heterocapsa_arctica.AAC.1
MPLFQKHHTVSAPRPEAFFEEYASELAELMGSIPAFSPPPLTVERVRSAIRSMPSRAHGLDNWSVDDFKSLPESALGPLTEILKGMGTSPNWAEAFVQAMMALPPKAGSDKADDLRPLTILS